MGHFHPLSRKKQVQKHPFLALQTARRGWASASDLWTWRFQRKSLSKRFLGETCWDRWRLEGGKYNGENHLGLVQYGKSKALRDTDSLVLYIQNIGVSYRFILNILKPILGVKDAEKSTWKVFTGNLWQQRNRITHGTYRSISTNCGCSWVYHSHAQKIHK